MKSEILPHLPAAKRGYASKGNLAEVIQSILYKLKTGCQWQITSSFSWFCFRCLWAACPATARAGGSNRTCFPRRCLCACIWQNRFCLVFSNKFNIMSALSVHQSRTLPQKIDSREGLFWCKKGVVCECGKMNFYLKEPSFAPVLGLFAAKCSAICC